MQTLKYQITELANGIRVITETVSHIQFMSMGVWVGVGSRYEKPQENGITHFIEHMLFKGTDSRTAEDISSAVDAVGGQINAFTSKETTCYYIKTLIEDFPLAVDLLADMLLHSKLDEEELRKEREVIIEEIKMYEDAADEYVQELLSAHMWQEHSLGRSILGTEETLATFTHDTLADYMQRYYTGKNMVISVVGNLTHEEVVAAVQKYFGEVPAGEKNQYAVAPIMGNGEFCHQKDIGQCQICFATKGVAKSDPAIYPMSILNTYLGGGMSSRLVKTIREELGLAYSVYSYHGAYLDAGAFVVNAGTRPENCQQVIDLIREEIEKVAKEGISEEALAKTFQQLKGNMFMSLETVNSRMNKLGRGLLLYDRIITPEEDVEKLSKVTVQDVQQIAQQMFKEDNYLLTVLGPVEDVHF